MSAGPSPGPLLGTWSPDPLVLTLLLGAGGAYLYNARRAPRWPVMRTLLFLGGLGALAVALMSGVDTQAELLLSVHMIQHLLLALVVPALLLSGAPLRLALSAAPGARRALSSLLHSRACSVLAHPACGLSLFSATMLVGHLPAVYGLALRDPAAHALLHLAYLLSGTVFLAPLIAADPIPRAPGAIARFAWSMAGMAAMAIPGAVLTFDDTVAYPHYLAPARALHRSALRDEHVAGAIMWVGGGIVMFTLTLAITMRALQDEERRQLRRELHENATAGNVREGVLGR